MANQGRTTPAGSAPTLDEAMAMVSEMEMETEDGQERMVPYLYLFDDEGAVTVAALAGAPGALVAVATRALVLLHQPAVAVLSMESWRARVNASLPREQQGPLIQDWLDRRAAGEKLGVRDLPGDYLQDVLLLIGEDRRGHEAFMQYEIKVPRAGETRRQFIKREGGKESHSRFRPLFALERARREGMPEAAARAAIVAELKRAQGGS